MGKISKLLFKPLAVIALAGVLFTLVWCILNLKSLEVVEFVKKEGIIADLNVPSGPPYFAIVFEALAAVFGIICIVFAFRKRNASKAPIYMGIVTLILCLISFIFAIIVTRGSTFWMLLTSLLPPALFLTTAYIRFKTAPDSEKPEPELVY